MENKWKSCEAERIREIAVSDAERSELMEAG
jgi:hypothetical protein